eukprot:5409857-Amphidinium_carterae.2
MSLTLGYDSSGLHNEETKNHAAQPQGTKEQKAQHTKSKQGNIKKTQSGTSALLLPLFEDSSMFGGCSCPSLFSPSSFDPVCDAKHHRRRGSTINITLILLSSSCNDVAVIFKLRLRDHRSAFCGT